MFVNVPGLGRKPHVTALSISKGPETQIRSLWPATHSVQSRRYITCELGEGCLGPCSSATLSLQAIPLGKWY